VIVDILKMSFKKEAFEFRIYVRCCEQWRNGYLYFTCTSARGRFLFIPYFCIFAFVLFIVYFCLYVYISFLLMLPSLVNKDVYLVWNQYKECSGDNEWHSYLPWEIFVQIATAIQISAAAVKVVAGSRITYFQSRSAVKPVLSWRRRDRNIVHLFAIYDDALADGCRREFVLNSPLNAEIRAREHELCNRTTATRRHKNDPCSQLRFWTGLRVSRRLLAPTTPSGCRAVLPLMSPRGVLSPDYHYLKC